MHFGNPDPLYQPRVSRKKTLSDWPSKSGVLPTQRTSLPMNYKAPVTPKNLSPFTQIPKDAGPSKERYVPLAAQPELITLGAEERGPFRRNKHLAARPNEQRPQPTEIPTRFGSRHAYMDRFAAARPGTHALIPTKILMPAP
eukprot:gnl/Trimastix_PCT/4769.p1 GENE.gnl/Trimastix_PCT/4769~~gnl/Trimastix_PCT/4769.p1  ORF type:complete len:142 (+),score=1.15 gnl/Trimastix_PCT/4769:55-480(+)